MVQIYKVLPRKRKSIFGGLSINTTLILINVIVFIVLLILGFFSNANCDLTICKYVALKPSNVLSGNYLWTFITSMFMHAGFFHLFVNMISMLFIGSLVERILGRRRYLYFYLIAGLFASLLFVFLSLVFAGDFSVYAVGASGALFGLVGLLVLLTPNLPVYVMFIPIPIKMKYAGIGLLIVLWLISLTANVGIGNTAHLGGLIAGLVYGIYLRNRFPNKIKAVGRHFS